MSSYIDYELIKKYPNKYGFTPKNIKTVQILDWDKLKKHTWYNEAMKKTGHWWCHFEGNQPTLLKFLDNGDEFWIGFREEDNKVDCHFSCFGGMAWYRFDEFYNAEEIENIFDMQVQIYAIRYLNMLVEEGIISEPRKEK